MWGMVQIDILFLIVFTNVHDKRAEQISEPNTFRRSVTL